MKALFLILSIIHTISAVSSAVCLVRGDGAAFALCLAFSIAFAAIEFRLYLKEKEIEKQ